jgi:hypothetical protein
MKMGDYTRARLAAYQVHPLFVAHGWTWGVGITQVVPDKDMIEDQITEMIRRVLGGEDAVITGRLMVEKDDEEDYNIYLHLS